MDPSDAPAPAPTTIVDPLSWISAERQVVTDFAASSAQAQSDLSGTVADFLASIQDQQSSEAQFTDGLASLTGAVNPVSVAQALQDLTSTDAAIDAAFAQLQATILQNNASAASLAQQVATVAPQVQQVNQSRSAIQAKIASYSGVINTFRKYSAAAIPVSAAIPAPIQ